jgi:hypothetical protein
MEECNLKNVAEAGKAGVFAASGFGNKTSPM